MGEVGEGERKSKEKFTDPILCSSDGPAGVKWESQLEGGAELADLVALLDEGIVIIGALGGEGVFRAGAGFVLVDVDGVGGGVSCLIIL